jgi:agmatinase
MHPPGQAGSVREEHQGADLDAFACPVYLCWDMDVFDPSVAPGVCTPTWGGLTAREGIELMRTLTGLHIVAADFNTVSPPHDVQGMAASLCAHMMMEAMALLARQFGLVG